METLPEDSSPAAEHRKVTLKSTLVTPTLILRRLRYSRKSTSGSDKKIILREPIIKVTQPPKDHLDRSR